MKPAVTEASLDQLLEDPITRLVMQRDGVSEGDIRHLMAGAAAGRRRRLDEAWKETFQGQEPAG